MVSQSGFFVMRLKLIFTSFFSRHGLILGSVCMLFVESCCAASLTVREEEGKTNSPFSLRWMVHVMMTRNKKGSAGPIMRRYNTYCETLRHSHLINPAACAAGSKELVPFPASRCRGTNVTTALRLSRLPPPLRPHVQCLPFLTN